MANWARTDYRIEGNQKDLQEIYNLCKAFDNSERPVMEDGASKDWEGNIILALGIEKGESYLRGFIQSCELSDGLLCIEAQEAWGATDFRHLLEKHYNGMKVYYIVEEDGCEVYATNDIDGKYFAYHFIVASCIEGEDEYEEFKSEEEALAYAAVRIKRDTVTIADIDKWNEEHEYDDDYISIHEFKFVAQNKRGVTPLQSKLNIARLRLEYKSEPEKGEPFIKAEGYIEVMYNSELEEMKAKLLALGIKSKDMKVYWIEQMNNLQVTESLTTSPQHEFKFVA